MSSQYVQAHRQVLDGSHIAAPTAPLARRLSQLSLAMRHVFEVSRHTSADAEMLSLANRWQRSHPKLARELRSYVRGGSTY